MADRKMSRMETLALEYIRFNIPRLEAHLTGTRDFALEINSLHNLGIDEEKVAVAALCHDLARLVEPDMIVSELERRGIDYKKYNYVTPILLHGLLSAELAYESIGLSDVETLDAIRRHATGDEIMTDLDKLIYTADKIEPNRTWPGVENLRAAVRHDFESGYREVLGGVIRFVVAQNWPLDYNSVAAWNNAII